MDCVRPAAASLSGLEPEPREKRLRGIEIIAGEDGRKPLLHGAVKLAGLNLDDVLQLAQAVEFL